MITDTSYSFFSCPDGANIIDSLPRRPHEEHHDAHIHAHPSATSVDSVTSVDSTYGFFSSPTLKEETVKLDHPHEKSHRVENMSSTEFVHESEYTEFGI